MKREHHMQKKRKFEEGSDGQRGHPPPADSSSSFIVHRDQSGNRPERSEHLSDSDFSQILWREKRSRSRSRSPEIETTSAAFKRQRRDHSRPPTDRQDTQFSESSPAFGRPNTETRASDP